MTILLVKKNVVIFAIKALYIIEVAYNEMIDQKKKLFLVIL